MDSAKCRHRLEFISGFDLYFSICQCKHINMAASKGRKLVGAVDQGTSSSRFLVCTSLNQSYEVVF